MEVQTCPPATVFEAGRCVAVDAGVAPTGPCKEGDLSGCDARCQQGDAASCVLLAGSLDTVATPGSKKIQLLRRACDLNHAEGCAKVAEALEEDQGEGGPEAERYYELACEKGQAGACRTLAERYRSGRYAGDDPARALQFLQKACDVGSGASCQIVGEMLYRGDHVTQDWNAALTYFHKACDQRDADGCQSAAACHRLGQGTAKDSVQAAAYYQRACDLGVASSCNSLGWQYQQGAGVSRDATKAVELFRKACQLGSQAGCDSLAYMHQNGKGTAQNEREAARVFEFACDRNEWTACINLGLMTLFGRGVARDGPRGWELLNSYCGTDPRARLEKDCADVVDQESCGMAALLYAIAACGPKDLAAANRLLKKACDQGYRWPCDRMREVGTVPKSP